MPSLAGRKAIAKNATQMVGLNPHPIIRDLDANPIGFGLKRTQRDDFVMSFVIHQSVFGIAQQICQDLQDLRTIKKPQWQLRVVTLKFDAMPAEGDIADPHCVFDHVPNEHLLVDAGDFPKGLLETDNLYDMLSMSG